MGSCRSDCDGKHLVDLLRRVDPSRRAQSSDPMLALSRALAALHAKKKREKNPGAFLSVERLDNPSSQRRKCIYAPAFSAVSPDVLSGNPQARAVRRDEDRDFVRDGAPRVRVVSECLRSERFETTRAYTRLGKGRKSFEHSESGSTLSPKSPDFFFLLPRRSRLARRCPTHSRWVSSDSVAKGVSVSPVGPILGTHKHAWTGTFHLAHLDGSEMASSQRGVTFSLCLGAIFFFSLSLSRARGSSFVRNPRASETCTLSLAGMCPITFASPRPVETALRRSRGRFPFPREMENMGGGLCRSRGRTKGRRTLNRAEHALHGDWASGEKKSARKGVELSRNA